MATSKLGSLEAPSTLSHSCLSAVISAMKAIDPMTYKRNVIQKTVRHSPEV